MPPVKATFVYRTNVAFFERSVPYGTISAPSVQFNCHNVQTGRNETVDAAGPRVYTFGCFLKILLCLRTKEDLF